MYYKTINAMSFKIGNLPDYFLILKGVIPEPERHNGKLTRRINKIVGRFCCKYGRKKINAKKSVKNIVLIL
jgi:hypothetical protein